VTCTAVLM